jgi:thiamine-monophosphate kinase
MSRNKKSESGEDRLIALYFKPIAKHPGAFGLIDDAAAVTPPKGCDLVLKTDGIIGGVHFFPDDPPDTVAKKALRVNLSDLAAKGAKPLGFLLTLALPKTVGPDWLKGFARGLGQDADRYGCPLFGGDTDRTPGPITISIAAFGVVPRGKMVRRSGARVGDRVLVTGTIGDAALGLLVRGDAGNATRWGLDRGQERHLVQRYLVPEPRNAAAAAVLSHASGSMDVSDGLAGDLAKLCKASGVTAAIDIARVPLSSAARAALKGNPELIETILAGGDDYEVLVTVPPRRVEPFRKAAAAVGVATAEIGAVAAGTGAPRFLSQDGRPLALHQRSYSHF